MKYSPALIAVVLSACIGSTTAQTQPQQKTQDNQSTPPNAASGMGTSPGIGSGSSYDAGSRSVTGAPTAPMQQTAPAEGRSGDAGESAKPDGADDCRSVMASVADPARCPPRPSENSSKNMGKKP